MTEFELCQYRAIQKEIEDISLRINRFENMGTPMVSDRVKGSSKQFPYIAKHFYITGVDTEANEKRKRIIKELQKKRGEKLNELLSMECRIHDYIYTIPDSEIRQIFVFRYIDGLSQEEIGLKLHMDRSGVSKRITKYLGETKVKAKK